MTNRSLAVVLGAMTLGVPVASHSHEGHDHSPGQVQAPHGGLIQKAADYYVEVRGSSSDVKIYFLKSDLKVMPLAGIKAQASMQLPKKKTKEKIELTPNDDHFSGQLNAKGMHRYQLEVEMWVAGKRELLTFQVEPQD